MLLIPANMYSKWLITKQTFTRSKLIIETLEKDVEYVKRQQ